MNSFNMYITYVIIKKNNDINKLYYTDTKVIHIYIKN